MTTASIEHKDGKDTLRYSYPLNVLTFLSLFPLSLFVCLSSLRLGKHIRVYASMNTYTVSFTLTGHEGVWDGRWGVIRPLSFISLYKQDSSSNNSNNISYNKMRAETCMEKREGEGKEMNEKTSTHK